MSECSPTEEFGPYIVYEQLGVGGMAQGHRGVVKLIDFGIAKASGGGMQTMGDTLKGKFGYMAPEYIAGRIDARADLFAVGVIAHELLTNRPLFSGRDDIDQAAAADRHGRQNGLAPRTTATAVVSPTPRPSAAVPVFSTAPLAVPRPLARSPAALLPYDPARSATVARDFAQRVSAPSTTAAAPARSGHRLAVVLVVLAAAIAAITVYFVLPLLT